MNGALLAKQRQLGELEARVATLQEQLQVGQGGGGLQGLVQRSVAK